MAVKWKQFNLIDLVTISNKKVGVFEGEKEYIATGDIDADRIVSNQIVTYENKPSRADLLLTENDVLFAKMKSTVKVLVGKKEYEDKIFSTGFYIITPKENLSLSFLYFFLNSKEFNLQKDSYCTGATMSAITNEGLKKIKIKVPINEKGLPDIIEQERITKLLEEAENIKNKRSLANIAITKLVPSLFFGIFGDPNFNEHNWPIVKLKDIAQIKIGPFGSLLHQNEYIKGGIPLVNPSHIIDGKIVADLDLTIGKSKAESLSSYRMKVGDIVLGRRGEMGRCAIVTKNEEGFLCGTGSIFITPLEGLSSLFLHTLLSSSQMKLILESIAKGVTMKNLNSSNLEELKIYLPPIELQKKFAFLIEEIEAQKNKQKESTQKVDELFNAVMAKSFA